MPRLDLLDLVVRRAEDERRVDVSPQRVTPEIEQVEVVPPEVAAALEIRARVTSLRDRSSGLVLDPDVRLLQHSSPAGPRVRLEDDARLGRRHGPGEAVERTALALEHE